MATPSARSEKLKGARFGPYEIVRLIGHGATASVFEAVHVALGKEVAVKLLHEHLAADEQITNRFLREGRVGAKLRHPNIVGILDVGLQDGVPYLVMELLDGRDLRTLLEATHTLTVEHALTFLLPIASALAHAHAAGVLHRDLKPANIFLARDVRDDVVPKLVDFGLSKMQGPGEATSSLTATDLVAGTVLYMAPEQTEGVKNASPASDQYALAAILYECLTGEAPFTADTMYALIDRIRTGMPKPPSTVDPSLGVPAQIDSVVLRALEHDPANRYPSIRDLARELIPFASAETTYALERDFAVPGGAPSGKARASAPSLARRSSSRTPAGKPAVETRLESSGSIKIQKAITPLPTPAGTSPFHIKGMPYRGLIDFVTKSFPGGVEGLSASIEDPTLAAFVRQPFLASGRYDVLPMVPIFETLSRRLGMSFDTLVYNAAKWQARYDARTVFKRIFEGATVSDLADRITRFGAQYYDFGKFTGSIPEPNLLSIVHAGFPVFLEPWYGPMHLAYTCECARIVGAKTIVDTKQSFEPAGTTNANKLRYPLISFRTDVRWA